MREISKVISTIFLMAFITMVLVVLIIFIFWGAEQLVTSIPW